jgi:hypothetical protein
MSPQLTRGQREYGTQAGVPAPPMLRRVRLADHEALGRVET